MAFFSNSKQESEEMRGVPDVILPKLSNEQLILLALARLFEAEGVEDEVLIAEMRRRGRQLP